MKYWMIAFLLLVGCGDNQTASDVVVSKYSMNCELVAYDMCLFRCENQEEICYEMTCSEDHPKMIYCFKK